MIVRRCTFTGNGTAGLWGYSAGSILLEDCVFERNNWLGRNTWEEADLKYHAIERSIFRNNLFRDNDSFGLWLDICGGNNRITQNLFISNMNAGVFIEAGLGTTLVDNNISAYSRPFTFYQMTQADGFYNHQSSNVIFAHNLAFGNAGYGFRCLLWGESGSNPFGGVFCKVSHNRVLNNIAYANARGAVSLPVDQRLCWDNVSAGNFFWGATDAPLFELQRGIMAPSELVRLIEKSLADHAIPAYEAPVLNREGRAAVLTSLSSMATPRERYACSPCVGGHEPMRQPAWRRNCQCSALIASSTGTAEPLPVAKSTVAIFLLGK